MNVGYARISTDGQTHAAQITALKAAGCDKIFTETASGAKKDRPVLAKALAYLRPNTDDKLVVYKLDRVARSLPHLIEIMDRLNSDGIEFQSLTEAIDTKTPGGRLLFHVMGAIVRRQSFWHQWQLNLREGLAHLVGFIMRRAACDASVALRVSCV